MPTTTCSHKPNEEIVLPFTKEKALAESVTISNDRSKN
jgi:hypothetical protein